MSNRFVSLRSAAAGAEVPRIGDAPSFLGVPVALTADALRDADVAIVGIPSGAQASPGRPPGQWATYGRGPADARRFSLRYGGYLPDLDLDVLEQVRVVDYGDATIVPGDVGASLASVDRKVRDVLDAGCRLVTLGGCVPYASYGVVTALARATTAGRVGVISLDAHGDCLDSIRGMPNQGELGAGTWQRRMWEDAPAIDPTLHVEIGMRGPRNIREMVETYRAKRARLYPAATVRRLGMAAVCAEAFGPVFAGAARTWLSLDMDVLDFGAIPGWADEPLGVSARDVICAVHEAGKAGLDALSFQFIAPDSPAASAVVAYIVVYLIAGWLVGGALAARPWSPPARP
jgi:arginase family enzyme